MEDRIIRSARITGPLALLALAVWGTLVYAAPVEKEMGIIQKIMYVHVPCAPAAYLGFLLTAAGGIGFLNSRRDEWDRFALAAAQVGVVFCSLILVSGPIWAKPAWGQWWAWDLRLTSTLVLWFIYVAYLLLRAFAVGSDPARTFASVYGIVGTLVIPFVYYAVDLAKGSTMHPSDPAREGLPPEMAWALRSGMIAFVIVFAYLWASRIGVARLEAQALAAEQGETPWAT